MQTANAAARLVNAHDAGGQADGIAQPLGRDAEQIEQFDIQGRDLRLQTIDERIINGFGHRQRDAEKREHKRKPTQAIPAKHVLKIAGDE